MSRFLKRKICGEILLSVTQFEYDLSSFWHLSRTMTIAQAAGKNQMGLNHFSVRYFHIQTIFEQKKPKINLLLARPNQELQILSNLLEAFWLLHASHFSFFEFDRLEVNWSKGPWQSLPFTNSKVFLCMNLVKCHSKLIFSSITSNQHQKSSEVFEICLVECFPIA